MILLGILYALEQRLERQKGCFYAQEVLSRGLAVSARKDWRVLANVTLC